VTLTGLDPDNPTAPLNFGAKVFSDSTAAAAFNLEQSLLLVKDPFAAASDPYDTGSFGLGYKWLYGNAGLNAAGNHYYFLLPDGELHSWDGTGSPNVSASTLVATFDASYFADPTKLLNPTTASGVTVSVGGSQGSQVQFNGMSQGQTLFAVAFVTDGLLTARQTFQINVGA
jgi:hypothetical protein